MARIKLQRSDLDAAYAKTGALVSNSNAARLQTTAVANAISDMRFGGKDALISNLHTIETRLLRQEERMQRLGAIMQTIGSELTEADTAIGISAKAVLKQSSVDSADLTGVATSLATAVSWERWTKLAGLFLSGTSIIGASIGVYETLKGVAKFMGWLKKGTDNELVHSGVAYDGTATTTESVGKDGTVTTKVGVDTKFYPGPQRTEEERRILEKTKELQNKEGFRQGDYWGYGNYTYTYNGVYVDGWSCYAKAFQMQIEVMGKSQIKGETIWYPAPSQIQPGDVLHYYRDDGSQHYVFVISSYMGNLYIGEGNATDGIHNEIVNYRTVDLQEFCDSHNIEQIYR